MKEDKGNFYKLNPENLSNNDNNLKFDKSSQTIDIDEETGLKLGQNDKKGLYKKKRLRRKLFKKILKKNKSKRRSKRELRIESGAHFSIKRSNNSQNQPLHENIHRHVPRNIHYHLHHNRHHFPWSRIRKDDNKNELRQDLILSLRDLRRLIILRNLRIHLLILERSLLEFLTRIGFDILNTFEAQTEPSSDEDA